VRRGICQTRHALVEKGGVPMEDTPPGEKSSQMRIRLRSCVRTSVVRLINAAQPAPVSGRSRSRSAEKGAPSCTGRSRDSIRRSEPDPVQARPALGRSNRRSWVSEEFFPIHVSRRIRRTRNACLTWTGLGRLCAAVSRGSALAPRMSPADHPGACSEAAAHRADSLIS
jgi:hypothetical protein